MADGDQEKERVKIINDIKDRFRYRSIEDQGNDPAVESEPEDVEESLDKLKSEIEKDNTEMNFIEIILREGNMIYIPFGWFYFIYGNHLDLDTPDRNPFRETIILNCINKSLINF